MITHIERLQPAERPAGLLLAAVALMLVALLPAMAILEIPLPIVAGVGGLLALVALAIRPNYGTLVVVGIVWSNAAVVAVRIHDVPFFLAAGSSALLAAPLGYYLLVRREPLIIPRAVPWILGYFLVLLVSTMLARNSSSASESVWTFVSEGLLLYVLVVNVVRDERMLLRSVWVLLAVGAVLGALSLHQNVTGNFGNDYLGFAQVGGDPNVLVGEEDASRTAGPLARANRYAQIMVLLLPLVLAILWGRYSRRSSVLAIGAAALISVAVALTMSRGAAVGFGLVLVLMLVLRYIRVRHIALVVFAVIALLIAVPEYGARLESLERVPGLGGSAEEADGSVRSRITETIAAALVFADHPVIGVGPGQFPSYYMEYAAEFGLRVRVEDREAHNLYFGIASDVGLLGSFFFFGAIGVTIRDLARTRSRLLAEHPRLAYLATGLLLAIVTYLTTGIFLHLSFERYLWLLLALGAAATTIGWRLSEADPERQTGSSARTTPAA